MGWPPGIPSAAVRVVAEQQGWLDVSQPFPSPEQVLSHFSTDVQVPEPHSKLEPHPERVQNWLNLGYKPKQIHRKLKDLKRMNPEAVPYDASLGSVKRFVAKMGNKLPDPFTGEIKQTQVCGMTLCHSRHKYAELVDLNFRLLTMHSVTTAKSPHLSNRMRQLES